MMFICGHNRRILWTQHTQSVDTMDAFCGHSIPNLWTQRTTFCGHRNQNLGSQKSFMWTRTQNHTLRSENKTLLTVRYQTIFSRQNLSFKKFPMKNSAEHTFFLQKHKIVDPLFLISDTFS